MRTLLLLQARRDRRQLLVWVLALGLLVVATGSAVLAQFPTEADRRGLLTLGLATPALLALRGAPQGSSTGSVLFFQLFSWLAAAVGLMNAFLSSRHGRGDEEHGRRELVLAGPLRRTAPVVATLVLGVAANLAVAVVTAGAFRTVGQDLVGSLVAGLALGATGFAFLGAGLLANQVAPTSRAANGLVGAFVGLAYLLRAAGDALGTVDLERLTLRPAWPSWLSPIGWGELTFALTTNRWWPLLISVAFGGATSAAALVLQSRRDLGASLLVARPGRASGSAALRTHLGLAWRLQRSALLGWALGGAALGLFTGSLATAVAEATVDNPQVTQVLESLAAAGGQVDTTGLLLSAILGLVAVLAAAAGVQAVLRLRSEETDGHAELLLATPPRRTRWLASWLAVGGLSVVVVLLGSGLAAAASFVALDDPAHAGDAVAQAVAAVPAGLVLVGATTLLVSLVPRSSTGLAWALFTGAVVLGLFGGLLDMPAGVRDLSPFSHLPAAPAEHLGTLGTLLAVALALAGVGLAGLRRRELSP